VIHEGHEEREGDFIVATGVSPVALYWFQYLADFQKNKRKGAKTQREERSKDRRAGSSAGGADLRMNGGVIAAGRREGILSQRAQRKHREFLCGLGIWTPLQ